MNVQKIVIHKLPDNMWHMMNSHINAQCQYLVQAPLAVMVALHLFCMPLMICWNLYCGMAFHSMMNAFSNSCKELKVWWFSGICLFTYLVLAMHHGTYGKDICMLSMSKTWSIAARSGERLGLGNALTLLACIKFMERRAVCDQAVSC